MARASRRLARNRNLKRTQSRAPRTIKGGWLLWLVAAAAILVLAGGVLARNMISGHSHNSSSTQSINGISVIELKEDEEIEAILQGIPQHGITLGLPTAPYTLQFYGDLQDFTSKIFAVSFLPSIVYELVRKNELKIEFHGLETDTHDPQTFARQQMAALAAGQQGKLWNYILTFFHEQRQEYTNYATPRYLNRIARQIPGMNLQLWARERANPQLFKQVTTDWETTKPWPQHITPTFFFGRSGGKMIQLQGYEMRRLPGTLLDAVSVKEAIEKTPLGKPGSRTSA